MKYHAPSYSDDDSIDDDDDIHDRRKKMAGDCPSQLSDERPELLELQWRDGCPVEQPVLDSRGSDNDAAAGEASSSPEENKKQKAGGGGPKDGMGPPGEAVDEWWKLWREGESGGAAAAAAHGYPRAIDDLSSVNAKVATTPDEAADELWRLWREGHGSSAPQLDSSRKNSASNGEDSLLRSSASASASRGSDGAQRHSSEQIDQQCSTLDHAIEHMKSLQQQIQVLSRGGYGMQQLLFPCVCGQQPPLPAIIPGPAPAQPLCPALPSPPPPPPPPPAAAPPLYQPVPPPQPAADLNPDMVAAGRAPGSVPGLIGAIGTGLGEEMAWNTSEMPFGGCARCSFRRRAGDC